MKLQMDDHDLISPKRMDLLFLRGISKYRNNYCKYFAREK